MKTKQVFQIIFISVFLFGVFGCSSEDIRVVDMRGTWTIKLKLSNEKEYTRTFECVGGESAGEIIFNGAEEGNWTGNINNVCYFFLMYYSGDLYYSETYYATVDSSWRTISGTVTFSIEENHKTQTWAGTFTGKKK